MASEPQTTPIEVPKSDQAIWLSYAKEVKNALTANQPLADNQVLYICPPTYVGLGVGLREEEINRDIYNAANILLPPDSGALFTTGNAEIRYFERMRQLAVCIDPDRTGNISTEAKGKVNELQKNWTDATRAYETAKKEATLLYNKYLAKQTRQGNKKPQGFEAWSGENASEVLDYSIGVQAALDDYLSLCRQTYGKSFDLIEEVQGKYTKAAKSDGSLPGYNMPTVYQVAADKKIEANDIEYTPAFGLTGYRDLLKTWKNSDLSSPVTWTLSAQKGKQLSWSDFNQDESHSKSGNKVWIIFNNENEATEKTTKSIEGLENSLDSVEFKLKIGALNSFPVSRGSWDQGDLRKSWKMSAQAPNATKLVVPTTLLVGYGVGLEANFDDSARNQVKNSLSHFENTKEAGLSILGFQVKESKELTKLNETKRDDVKFSSDKGSISIPLQTNRVPVLLGVIGQKKEF